MPTQFKVVPTDEASTELLTQLSAGFRGSARGAVGRLPRQGDRRADDVARVHRLPSRSLITAFLLVSSVLLIWNTIRTAMFARRREIEVMKLVGATNWFIRLPFMLEGLLQGLIGGVARERRDAAVQPNWTSGVKSFPSESGFGAFVVTDGYPIWIVGVVIVLGMLVGAIGSGTAVALPRRLTVASLSLARSTSLRSRTIHASAIAVRSADERAGLHADHLRRRGRVATITLNRPDQLNAFTGHDDARDDRRRSTDRRRRRRACGDRHRCRARVLRRRRPLRWRRHVLRWRR